jgi:DNA-binding NarL/FixJ family response regulator
MRSIRVLLVDDNPTFLRVTARFLSAEEDIHLVATLRGAAEALARMAELTPDVVLIDLAMPELPGLDAIPRLRAARPEAGIIALTLLQAEAYRQSALAAGADVFVPKCLVTTELLPAIRRVAAARRATPPPTGP